MSLRISATLLESFRLYQSEDWYKEQDLIDGIKGQLRQTPKMRLGQAYHYLLEHPQLTLDGVYERNGLRFAPYAIDSVLERLSPGGVFETKVAKTIGPTREGDELVLVAKADYIQGLHLSEFKAPLDGQFDAEKYERSYQWRVMVLLYGVSKVTYHIACLKQQDDGLHGLRSLDSMDLYPYSALEGDVSDLIGEFLHYVRLRKLDGYLRREDHKKAVPA